MSSGSKECNTEWVAGVRLLDELVGCGEMQLCLRIVEGVPITVARSVASDPKKSFEDSCSKLNCNVRLSRGMAHTDRGSTSRKCS
mmetsp:Transcript_52251/g.84516  ORF Transcript_52251/g.84516 Transcript_52251/m.84516 type:complete len:85 (-) Transcript_52251:256-510(-)